MKPLVFKIEQLHVFKEVDMRLRAIMLFNTTEPIVLDLGRLCAITKRARALESYWSELKVDSPIEYGKPEI